MSDKISKKEFFQQLHKEWQDAKKVFETEESIKESYKLALEQVPNLTPTSFTYVYLQMQKLGLPGFPVIDCKTFDMWFKEGYKVQKGEKSLLRGITWIEVKEKSEEGEEKIKFMYPKIYRLFHRSQVQK